MKGIFSIVKYGLKGMMVFSSFNEKNRGILKQVFLSLKNPINLLSYIAVIGLAVYIQDFGFTLTVLLMLFSITSLFSKIYWVRENLIPIIIYFHIEKNIRLS